MSESDTQKIDGVADASPSEVRDQKRQAMIFGKVEGAEESSFDDEEEI